MRVAAHSARRPRPPPGNVRPAFVPAPVLGIDAVRPAGALDALHALFAINVVAGDGGLKPRPGTQEHAINVGSVPGEVRSIIPYHSSGALDRLFATAQNGIYDVTAGGAAPTLKHTFGTQNANSGFGESLGFVNTAGAHFLLYCDEVNGYLLYTEGTDSFAAGSVTGVSPGALVNVMQHGARVWFTERDSTRGWYLGLGAISGAATSFDFGPFFTFGGTLRGIYRWTRDGGAGMNDLLVAVGSNADVVVFQGSDPTNMTLVGSWNVGGVPAGRRLAAPYGGDSQLLTLHGLLSLSRLVTGAALAPTTYESEAVRPLFANAMASMSAKAGWHVAGHPRGSFLMVNTPGVAGEAQEQFAMSYATRGWSRLRGYDMLSSGLWQGELYFGTRTGKVLKSTGNVDNVKLGGDTSQVVAIDCATLGGFSNLGSNNRKVVRFFRPAFRTHGRDPAFQAYVKFDYDMTEPAGSLAQPLLSAGTWDTGTWDAAQWGGLVGKTYARTGVVGVGTAVAFGVRFAATDYCVLVGYDVGIEEGGPL